MAVASTSFAPDARGVEGGETREWEGTEGSFPATGNSFLDGPHAARNQLQHPMRLPVLTVEMSEQSEPGNPGKPGDLAGKKGEGGVHFEGFDCPPCPRAPVRSRHDGGRITLR